MLKPLSGLIWGYEKIESYIIEELPKKMKNTAPDNIISPDLHLAGPLLESLKYTGNKESLRSMYLNLLSTSMDKELAKSAHPAFVEVIRQLSCDEAKLLTHLKGGRRYPEIDSERITSTWFHFEPYESIKRRFYTLCKNAELELPDSYLSYFDNLSRLNILEFRQVSGDITIKDKKHGRDMSIEQETNEYLLVTNFGQNFIDACLNDE